MKYRSDSSWSAKGPGSEVRTRKRRISPWRFWSSACDVDKAWRVISHSLRSTSISLAASHSYFRIRRLSSPRWESCSSSVPLVVYSPPSVESWTKTRETDAGFALHLLWVALVEMGTQHGKLPSTSSTWRMHLIEMVRG